jgi:quinol monooxygenase YgiN
MSKDYGNVVIAVYRPRAGQAEALERLVEGHVPALRKLGLVTGRDAIVLRAADGTVLEIFEWKSADAVERAHHDPQVQQIWGAFEKVCEWLPLASLPEAARPFPHFELVKGW